MALSISKITLRLTGTIAADITSVEVDGVAAVVAGDFTWTWSGDVPVGQQTVTVTCVGPTRRDVRVLEIVNGPQPVFAAG